jgi:FAD:protein FMN transferase
MNRVAANLEAHATGNHSPLLQSSRRASAWLLLVGLVFAHSGLANEPPSLVRYEATAPIMGCTFGIAAYGPDREALARHVESAFDEARKIDGWLSNYRADSELSRLNRSAADAPVRVSDELLDLLAKANEYSRASGGAFDMTVGPLVRAWGFYDGDGKLPDAGELARARQATGYQLVELHAARKTVHFIRRGVELDPGGIGKGYAVDRMVAALRRGGVAAALVNACHSSLYALGAPPDSPRGWQVEIDSPAGGAAVEVFLKDQSLSTSGSQEKFFRAHGHVYSHILDPRTGRPAEGVIAVSVIAPATLDSEAASTTIFVNGLDWASGHLNGRFRVYGCPSAGDCRWIRRGSHKPADRDRPLTPHSKPAAGASTPMPARSTPF